MKSEHDQILKDKDVQKKDEIKTLKNKYESMLSKNVDNNRNEIKKIEKIFQLEKPGEKFQFLLNN